MTAGEPLDRSRQAYRASAEPILWAQLDEDGESALYQCGAGKTHFLTWLGASILKQLEQAPQTIAELAAAAVAASDDDPAEVATSVADLVEHLEHLGLVDRVRPGQ